MRRSIWKAILLASVLGMTIAPGGVNATDKVKKAGAIRPAAAVETVVEAEAEPEDVNPHVYGRHPNGRPRQAKEGFKEGIRQKWESRTPLGCYGHFNDYSCNSLHSTIHFMFGSCRTFFGEACLKGPPASPVPGFDPYAIGVDRRNGRCPGCR